MTLTSHRVLQWLIILLILLTLGGAYWYFSVRGATRINSSQNSQLTNGLAGYWPFDGADISGTTVYDRSGNNKNATATGTTSVIGKIGQALDFGGTSDYLSVGNVGSVNSVSFWIKADNTTKKIIDLNGTQYIEVSAGTITATGFTSPTIYVDGAVASTIDTNWHHVVITTSSTITASAVDIGRVSSGYFDGKLDDVRMYNNVLSTAEITRLYHAGW